MMVKHHQEEGYFVEENLSNLTSPISVEASVSSSSNNKSSHHHQQEHYFSRQQPSDDQEHPEEPPAKKKRNMPGNPDPESEVISLSPKTLLATNRFICEKCSKGFQRDQNLQLHRRGHNLPWKLKQRSKTEVIKKKVYVCPETTCVHHDPSRALGDLTGIKKHFSRKHGEKKWKCDKCSKRYAVHSDWKAHSKVCGTREYRCDCGTLFSRRNNFITHRVFCDVLAEETARAIPSHQLLSNPTPSNSQFMTMQQQQQQQQHALQLMNMQQQQQQQHDSLPIFPLKIEHSQHYNHHNNLINLPPWLSCQPPIDNMPHHHINPSSSSLSSSSMFAHQNHTNSTMVGPTFLKAPVSVSPPHVSATALLQKATQMGATMSKTTEQQHIQGHVTDNPLNTTASRDNQQETMSSSTNTNTTSGVILNHGLSSFGNNNSTTPTTNCGPGSGSGSGPMFLQDMMVNNALSSSYDDVFGNQGPSSLAFHQRRGGLGRGHGDGGNDGLTRDFFGIKTTW